MALSEPAALVLAATIPAAITSVATVYTVRLSRHVSGMRDKVDETHHQVTVNSHSSETPTVLDRLADVAAIAAEAREAAYSAKDASEAIDARLTEHLSWSENETRNIWRAVWYAFRRGHERTEERAHDDLPEQR